LREPRWYDALHSAINEVLHGFSPRAAPDVLRIEVMSPHHVAGASVHVYVSGASDVDWARHTVHQLAVREGFREARAVALATAVSEIARNIVVHAARGRLSVVPITDGPRHGIVVVARDEGPGIPDIARAMEDGYSTKGSLGLGLSGAKRLVDEFEIESVDGEGVTITLMQWAEDAPDAPGGY
jgi:serine/threonine-protein kinase RsbT